MAFFVGQFVEHFKYSGLDKMLAMSGGQALAGGVANLICLWRLF